VVDSISDVDKNLGSVFIVIPVALMPVMLDKRVMVKRKETDRN